MSAYVWDLLVCRRVEYRARRFVEAPRALKRPALVGREREVVAGPAEHHRDDIRRHQVHRVRVDSHRRYRVGDRPRVACAQAIDEPRGTPVSPLPRAKPVAKSAALKNFCGQDLDLTESDFLPALPGAGLKRWQQAYSDYVPLSGEMAR